MLTRMTEDDWDLVLQVFNACRTRRGDRGTMTASSLKRFWRLSQNSVLMAFFEALPNLSQTKGLVNMFDSTVIRARVSAAGAKGS